MANWNRVKADEILAVARLVKEGAGVGECAEELGRDPRTIQRLGRRIGHRWRSGPQPCPIRRAKYMAFVAVGCTTTRALAKADGVGKDAAAGVVAGLIRDGLLVRTGAGRGSQLHLAGTWTWPERE